jgi:hypothetical protein
VNRQEFIDAVRAQAWDEGETCPTCKGEGRVRPGRRVVHCRGSFTGADWDEAAVVEAIEKARDVSWLAAGIGDHNLHVLTTDGKVWRFQVQPPDREVMS